MGKIYNGADVNAIESGKQNNIEDNIITATNYSVAIIQVTLTKSYIGENDLNAEITCTLNATAVERTSQGSGSVSAPVNPFYVGQEISIGDDDFYIIEDNTDNITLLTKYILDDTYRQNSTEFYSGDAVNMNSPGGWSTDVKDFDINVYSTEAVVYINNYVDYLKGVTGEDNISGNLITLMQLKDLGCSIDETYKTLNMYCNESPYKNIIFNKQRWATRSADGTYSKEYFVVSVDGMICSTDVYADGYIRPIITISKDVAYSLIDEYNVGQEIALGDEKFNVISDNGTTISMLAQYNIDHTYLNQTTEQMLTVFSSEYGWPTVPAPKEIDINEWADEVNLVLTPYLQFMKTSFGDDAITADLITLKQLERLGCIIPEDYNLGEAEWGDYTCAESEYSEWLINGQSWWTRSAESAMSSYVWMMYGAGVLSTSDNIEGNGVRPVITISKESLELLG